ncbi:MAG: hypothetical protein DRI34_03755 [Deltaproteobacteria bacterium]|nr:MAG: hypothetical protein DRI34_03755 [Deltaproteobacteria bacterium]
MKTWGRTLLVSGTLFMLSAAVVRATEEPGQELALDLSEGVAPATAAPGGRGLDPCLGREPALERVVHRAWEQAGLQPERDRSRLARARAAGWLPRLSGGFSKDLGGRWSWRYEQGTTVDQLQQDDGWSWQVSLSWDLAGTVWRGAELQEARASAQRALERMEIATSVIALYLERRRLLTARSGRGVRAVRWRLLELTALLDAWTGGCFRGSWCGVRP